VLSSYQASVPPRRTPGGTHIIIMIRIFQMDLRDGTYAARDL